MKDLLKKVFLWFDNNQKRFEDVGADYEQIVEEAITECGGENAIYTLLCPRISYFEDENGKRYELINDFKITIDSTGKLNFTVDIIGESHGIMVIPKYGA